MVDIAFLKICRIQKKLYLLVCCEDGFLYIYDVDTAEGGECTLLKQHQLVHTSSSFCCLYVLAGISTWLF